jgi:hypothetical protein
MPRQTIYHDAVGTPALLVCLESGGYLVFIDDLSEFGQPNAREEKA